MPVQRYQPAKAREAVCHGAVCDSRTLLMTCISSNEGAFKPALESIHVTDTYRSGGESCFQRKLKGQGYAYTKLREKDRMYYLLQRK